MFYVLMICGIAVVLIGAFGYCVKQLTCQETSTGVSAVDMPLGCSQKVFGNCPQNSSESRIAASR